ncbi:MAG TPA: HEAT repeat domain-containing protein [Pyrinomonadaceae bacterium]|nr:HEAT repeat domain-containing protein [Pyrinomonadaceae bacterium]
MHELSESTPRNNDLGLEKLTAMCVDWSWIVSLAQRCESIWNKSGRDAAKQFATSEITVEVLRKALAAGDALVRTKVLHMMSLWKSNEVLADLTAALRSDPCPIVRHEAAYFLGITRDPAAISALGHSLINDADELVRHEAAEALGETGLKEGLIWLEQARTDVSPLVRKTVEIAETYIGLSSSERQRNS